MKKFLFSVVMMFMVLGVLEVVSYVALRVLQHKGYMTEPGEWGTAHMPYSEYLRIRHPVLGWPYSEGDDVPGSAYWDDSGARRLPAFPDPSVPSCVSVYGDSFAQSFSVDAQHAWTNLLAKGLGCRVANYARAGYGSDQALLRHRLNAQDHAPIAILAHMHEDLARNLTRLRDLIHTGRDYSFKPRFIVDDRGGLQLVPMLTLSEQEYERAVGLRMPPLPLEHELFQSSGPLIAPPRSFPYVRSLVRAAGDYRLRARLHGNRPSYAEFYEPGNVTQGHELMLALARAFMQETRSRGQQGLLVFLPPVSVMRFHAESGEWIHQPLLDALDAEQIPYLDFGPILEQQTSDPQSDPFHPGGHYNEVGDSLLGAALATELRTRYPTLAAPPPARTTGEAEDVSGSETHVGLPADAVH